MRIGFDAKRAFRNFTGLGNYSRFIIKSISFNYPTDSYTLYTPQPSVNSETSFLLTRGIVVSPKGFFGFGFMKGLWRSVFNLILARDIDIFHGLSNELPWLNNRRVKKIVTIHDLLFIRYPELYAAIDRWIYIAKAKRACRMADVVIAVSTQTKEDIHHLLGIPDSKIKVVFQGCNEMFYEEWTDEQKAAVREKYNLPESFILSVGTIEERKNALVIARALTRLPDITLVLVGKPTRYTDQLSAYISTNGIQDRVIILPSITYSDLPGIYQSASMLVYPSIFEGFGIPIIEAMASAIPVITSNTGCFPESAGDAAILIDPHDDVALAKAIEKILSDNDFSNSLVLKGKKHIHKFSPSIIAKELNSIYHTVLKQL